MSSDQRGCTMVLVQVHGAEIPVCFASLLVAALVVALHAPHAPADLSGHPTRSCMPAPEHASALRERLAGVEERIAGLEAQPGADPVATLRQWEQTRLQLEFAVQLLAEFDPAGAAAMRDQIQAMERSFAPRRLALEAAAADGPALALTAARSLRDDIQHELSTCSSTQASTAARRN
jgi:hypothetical protein